MGWVLSPNGGGVVKPDPIPKGGLLDRGDRPGTYSTRRVLPALTQPS